MSFLKKIWTVSYTLINFYGVDPEIVMSDQMSLHIHDSSQEKALNFKDAPQSSTNNLCQGETFTLKRANNSNNIISV